MGISGDYPQPVQVNGFSCRNCTDVDNAKKHIDPAHPKDGPFGVNAASDATGGSQAVSFGGALKGHDAGQGPAATDPCRAGACLDVRA